MNSGAEGSGVHYHDGAETKPNNLLNIISEQTRKIKYIFDCYT